HVTRADWAEPGISLPPLVGGAALSEKFTRQKIAPSYRQAVCYAKDAMTGLHLMNQLSDSTRRDEVLQAHTYRDGAAAELRAASGPAAVSEAPSSRVRSDLPIPPAPYRDRKVRYVPDLNELWNSIKPYMLYGRIIGF